MDLQGKINYEKCEKKLWKTEFFLISWNIFFSYIYNKEINLQKGTQNIKIGGEEMKKQRKMLGIVLCMILMICVSGCGLIQSKINDIKGNLIGNGYTIKTYDNYGTSVMTTHGKKINIVGNPVETTSYDTDGNVITGYELSSVITINFTEETIESNSHGLSETTAVSNILNKYKNMFGKSRVVVVKSQLGQPIAAYSGNDVYWEIPENLPKMTKLMIDGKALYIHRANFQIIDTALLD